MGTTVRMGPGYVPHMLAYIMMSLGGIITVVALVTHGERDRGAEVEADHHGHDRHHLLCLLFERAGLLPALVVLVLIASLGGEEFKLTEVLGNMVALAVLCVLVFKVGLGMNISIITRSLVRWIS